MATKSVTVALTEHELKVLISLSDRVFPFFQFLDEDDKVKAAIEYLIEKEVATIGY